MQGIFFLLIFFLSLVALPDAALAKPSVALHLDGFVVSKDAKGQEKQTPLAETGIVPGQTLRYVITATNKGDQDARNMMPSAKIPAGTRYKIGSASTLNALRVEFSLDGGKTWSSKPMVTVHMPTGDVTKPADPSTYTALRWVTGTSLAPKAISTYSYEVRVK